MPLCPCKDTSQRLGPTKIQYNLILNGFRLQRPYFQTRPHSRVLGVRASTYLLEALGCRVAVRIKPQAWHTVSYQYIVAQKRRAGSGRLWERRLADVSCRYPHTHTCTHGQIRLHRKPNSGQGVTPRRAKTGDPGASDCSPFARRSHAEQG